MTRTQFLKETQKRLTSRRDALRQAIAGDMTMLSARQESDEIDAAIATEQAELRSQMASFESRELAQIESALEQIKHGRYGHCEICDKPIPAARLKALPYATECIACARRDERREAPAGRSSGPVNRIAAFTNEDNDTAMDEAYEEIR